MSQLGLDGRNYLVEPMHEIFLPCHRGKSNLKGMDI